MFQLIAVSHTLWIYGVAIYIYIYIYIVGLVIAKLLLSIVLFDTDRLTEVDTNVPISCVSH